MLDARSLALTPQARLRAATTPILSIYIYLFIRYKGHALTNGRGCSPGGLNSTTRSALATLADSSDIERPQPNTPNLYFLVSPRKMCGYAQAYGSDSHRRADEQPIIFWRYFRKYIL
mgnify:FL=1